MLICPPRGIVSLSARRAWIEIPQFGRRSRTRYRSLSARRAWIEIVDYIIDYATEAVALRKESVDRNFDAMQVIVIVMGRSPQGERG